MKTTNKQLKARNTVDRMMRIGEHGWKATKEKGHKDATKYTRKNYKTTIHS